MRPVSRKLWALKWRSYLKVAHFNVTGWAKTSPTALKFWSNQNFGQNMTGCFDLSWLEISFWLKKCHWNFSWLVPLVSTLQRCPLRGFFKVFFLWCLRTEVRVAWENSQHVSTPPVVSSPNDLWAQACSDFNNNNCHTNREWSLCGLRNECRNFTLMTCHYPDLDSVSDWLKQIFLAKQPTRSTTLICILGGLNTSSVWNFCRCFSDKHEKKIEMLVFFLRLGYGLLE